MELFQQEAIVRRRRFPAPGLSRPLEDLTSSGGAGLLKESGRLWWSRTLEGVWPALVEPTGIEPVTSCLQSRRSPS